MSEQIIKLEDRVQIYAQYLAKKENIEYGSVELTFRLTIENKKTVNFKYSDKIEHNKKIT